MTAKTDKSKKELLDVCMYMVSGLTALNWTANKGLCPGKADSPSSRHFHVSISLSVSQRKISSQSE